MESKTVSIYLREVDAEIQARGDNRSHVINRDLERLYALYKRALKEVPLSVQEAWLLVDVLNGSLMDANTARLLWANVEDGCALDGLDKKWEVDGKALAEKLRNLSDFQNMALIDAAEKFWQANNGSMTDDDLQKFFPQTKQPTRQ